MGSIPFLIDSVAWLFYCVIRSFSEELTQKCKEFIARVKSRTFVRKMEEKKYYMFRDLDHDSNLKDGKSFHAAGVVDKVFNTPENSDKNKDLSVTFLHPFTGRVIHAWRGYQEVELFECYDFEHSEMINNFSFID